MVDRKKYKQSIIIAYHKNKDLLYYTLELLIKTIPNYIEVIIVANNVDSTEIDIKSDFSQVKIIMKWSVPFISLSFLDYLFQYLSPIGRLYLAEKEVHEIPPCVLVQFVVQSSESFKIAVDVRFHHIHEDVVHLVISALLRCRLAVSFCHVGKG